VGKRGVAEGRDALRFEVLDPAAGGEGRLFRGEPVEEVEAGGGATGEQASDESGDSEAGYLEQTAGCAGGSRTRGWASGFDGGHGDAPRYGSLKTQHL